MTEQPALDQDVDLPGLEGATVDKCIPLATDQGEVSMLDGSFAEPTVDGMTPAEEDASSVPLQVQAPPSASAQDNPISEVEGSESVVESIAVAMVAGASASAITGCVGVSTEKTGIAVVEAKVDEPKAAGLIEEPSMVEMPGLSAEVPLPVTSVEAPPAVVDESDVEPTFEVEAGGPAVCDIVARDDYSYSRIHNAPLGKGWTEKYCKRRRKERIG